jgi:hypothetical protein
VNRKKCTPFKHFLACVRRLRGAGALLPLHHTGRVRTGQPAEYFGRPRYFRKKTTTLIVGQ